MYIVHYSLRWLCVCGTERRSTNLITTSQYVCQTYTYLQECVFPLGFKSICKEVGCSFAALFNVCVCVHASHAISQFVGTREDTTPNAPTNCPHSSVCNTTTITGVRPRAMLVLSFTIILHVNLK